MATKSCPQCDQQVPVACKSCPCGYIFISRKLLHAKQTERLPPSSGNRSDPKRRRTERIKRERIHNTVNRDLENRRRSRTNSQSEAARRGRGRPKTVSSKKQEEKVWSVASLCDCKKQLAAACGASRNVWRLKKGLHAQKEKQEKEVDMYANLSDEKAFVFSVALAEINRKIINQRLIL
ncbi:hypothetical protein GDO86_008153 [Hymenochirus boettgeri]|uniref:UPF0547 domain-containing protein n=2 Tax=Hymenochirus TaxID=8361 RepID=A0A8T2J1Q8_9PIPI|nr:hypothetical protein GDO86_008153 [Hymenochirus boettgeri]